MQIEKKYLDFKLNGYCEIKNLINKKELQILKKFVIKNLNKNNEKTFFLSSKSNNILPKFFKKNYFIENKIKNLILNFAKNLKIKNYKNKNFYMVLRVIKNERIKKESFQFHFDAYLITLLIPIFIPNRKNSNNGHLFIGPNMRKLTNYIIYYIFQKIYYQKILPIIIVHNNLINFFKLNKVILKPRSAFLFNGFRSLHGNADIDTRDTRATLLVHFSDIFEDSNLVKLNRQIRIWKENIRVKKNINDR